MKGRKIGCGTIVLALIGLSILNALFTPLLAARKQTATPPRFQKM